MATFEEHITAIENSELPSETVNVATDAVSFVMALHNLFVDQGVLNTDAEVDVSVLESLIDAYNGELAAAAILMGTQDQFKGVPELLRYTAKNMLDPNVDPDNVVPTVVRKGYERFANRIEKVRQLTASNIGAAGPGV